MNHLGKLLLISLAACTATHEDTGLTIDVRNADRISGSYESGGVVLAFDFSRQRDRHVLAFHGEDGRPLITTTLDGATQITDVLGGRLVIAGITNAPDPTIEGDRAAMAALHARPEAELLEGLHDALTAADIDADLYQPRRPLTSSIYDYDGRYFLFFPGESRDWLSAAGSSPTYIYGKNPWPTSGACAALRLEPWTGGAYETMTVSAYSAATRIRYWWGAIFTVRNLYSSWGGCQPAQVLVRVSPYTPSP